MFFSGSLYVMMAVYISLQTNDLVTDSSLKLQTSRGQSFHFAQLSHAFDVVVSVVTWQLYLAQMWSSLSEECEEIAGCPVTATVNNLTTHCFFSQAQKQHSALCSWPTNTCSSWWFLCTICIIHPFALIILSSFQHDLVVVEVKQIWKNYVCYCCMCVTLIWEEFSSRGWQNENWCGEPQVFLKGHTKNQEMELWQVVSEFFIILWMLWLASHRAL